METGEGVTIPCSPRTRGWSPDGDRRRRHYPLLPAHAGMVPAVEKADLTAPTAPRARGDGPHHVGGGTWSAPCSPRTRGWSRLPRQQRGPPPLLPAHAGMVPPGPGHGLRRGPAPRARGDGPPPDRWSGRVAPCSPRTRGWSLFQRIGGEVGVLLPAHAGMVPISKPSNLADGDCSPRTRGWSPFQGMEGHGTPLLPAHAGMVPPAQSRPPGRASAPRARGDGPSGIGHVTVYPACSPRTRGWSRHRRDRMGAHRLLPAHAGMVPAISLGWCRLPAAPRARGDGPAHVRYTRGRARCSPRTRGWSPRRPLGRCTSMLLPAHAGMVPRSPRKPFLEESAPRARGDGPSPGSLGPRHGICSPRTRGWSRL